MNKLLAFATIFYRILYISMNKTMDKEKRYEMTFLERTKEVFNMSKKGALILSCNNIIVYDIEAEDVNFDKELICERLEEWLYENDFDCMVIFNDTNYLNEPLTSIVIDCTDYLDDVMDRRKIRILGEKFLEKHTIKYKN